MAEENKIVFDEEYFNKLKDLISKTKFGSISLIIQDGKVIQIDHTEKIRIKK